MLEKMTGLLADVVSSAYVVETVYFTVVHVVDKNFLNLFQDFVG